MPTLGLVTGADDFFTAINEGWYSECARLDPGDGAIVCEDVLNENGILASRTCRRQHAADEQEHDSLTCEHVTDSRQTLPALNASHLYNVTEDKHQCLGLIRYFIERGDVDGIAARCPYRNGMPPIIQTAKDAGIPMVVYSGPHDNLGPFVSYVGTDHRHMGRTVARLLKQLRPGGGTYLATYNDGTSAERFHGFKEEIEKDNDRDDRAHWVEAPINYTELNEPQIFRDPPCYTGPYPGWDGCRYRGITRLGYDGIPFFLDLFHKAEPTAIVFLYQFPLTHHNYTDFVDRYRHLNISYIGVDGTADNLNFMARNYVDGLVGEQTYEMGVLAAKSLYQAVVEGPDGVAPRLPTKLINYNLVPDELPALEVDQSLLGNLKWAGFTCFTIVAIGVLTCAFWTVWNRRGIVVKASQPFFLVMTATGILVMASTMIPLSFDDNGEPISETRAKGICMSIPWLGFSGFCITFSALFSKTYRVNQFFKSTSTHGRIKVSEREVLLPFFVIFTLNVIVLICWTVIDPLTYVRRFDAGTDLWNREIASIGRCQSENGALPYLVPLGLINFVVLAVAFWQAYEARAIQSEFAEANFIAMAVFSLTQGFLTGIPIVAVAKDIPEAFYMILTILLFVVCMVVLLLIFLPKMIMQRRYAKMTVDQQKKAMAVSVRLSAGMQKEAPGSGSSTFRKSSSQTIGLAAAHTPALPKIDEKEAIVDGSSEITGGSVTGGSNKTGSEPGGSADTRVLDGGAGAFVAKADGSLVVYSSYIDEDD